MLITEKRHYSSSRALNPAYCVFFIACSAQGEDNQRAKRETVISEPFTLDPVTLAMVFHRSCDKSQE